MRIQIKMLLLPVMLLAAVLPGRSCAAQDKTPGYLIITGTLSGEAASKLVADPTLQVYAPEALRFNTAAAGSAPRTPLLLAGHRFYVKVPVSTKYVYLKLRLRAATDFLAGGYPLVMAGDSVHLAISEQGVRFSGDHAAALAYQYDAFEKSNYLQGITWDKQSVPRLFASCDSLVRAYREPPPAIRDPGLKNIMAANSASGFRTTLFTALYYLKFRKDTLLRNVIRRELDQVDGQWDHAHDALVLENSYNHVTAVLLFNELKSVFPVENKDQYFNVLYDRLSQHYAGLLKDQLITCLFLKKFDRKGDAQSLLPAAAENIKDSLCKALMTTIVNAKQKGSQAFDFKLPDVKGRTVSLSDFKGKTIVCHFWFTKCSACIILAKYMRQVTADFKNNPAVVFINVSVDRQKATWLTSVLQGTYTSKDELSLYTSGLGETHPFVRYYNYNSFPQLLVIGPTGRVASANPPQPRDNASTAAFEAFLGAQQTK